MERTSVEGVERLEFADRRELHGLGKAVLDTMLGRKYISIDGKIQQVPRGRAAWQVLPMAGPVRMHLDRPVPTVEKAAAELKTILPDSGLSNEEIMQNASAWVRDQHMIRHSEIIERAQKGTL